jgi:DNA (cytosine-5)-methyltransferase 1
MTTRTGTGTGTGRDGMDEYIVAQDRTGALACSGGHAFPGTCAQDAGEGFLVAHALRAEGFDASEDGTGRGTPIVPVAFDLRGREGGSQFEGPHDTANIRAASGGSSRSYVAFAQNTRDEVRLVGGDGQIVGANGAEPGMKQQAYIASQWAVRRLTPNECESLQGVPQNYTRIPWRGKPAEQCPDGPRYKALGNSWAVPVVAWIGRRIIENTPK